MTREKAAESAIRNLLTRALGAASDVEVDVSELTLSAGAVLVLFPDGLNTMVSDDDILTLAVSTKDPAVVCERLVALANEQGGRDNITVIVAYILEKKLDFFSIKF